jgi:hypothetical protein
MNVASLAVSEELYKLSKWIDTDARWYEDDGYFVTTDKPNGLWVPAYDLGYLIRKLPKEADGSHWVLAPTTDGWGMGYLKTELVASADTPQEVACKLAIALFKQGVLTKQEEG